DTAVLSLADWRAQGKPANLEQSRQAAARAQAGERREFPRYEATLRIRIARIPTWRDPSDQAEETVTDVVAKGGALVRSRMAVEKGDGLGVDGGKDSKTRAAAKYGWAPS